MNSEGKVEKRELSKYLKQKCSRKKKLPRSPEGREGTSGACEEEPGGGPEPECRARRDS